MLTLGINTASSTTSIALLRDGKLVDEQSWESANDEAEKLMPAIAESVKANGEDLSEINRVVVISGPGSFTGLRVGVTVANTIAYLNGCELFAVNTFDYWWAKIPAENRAEGQVTAKGRAENLALLIFAGSKGVYVNHGNKTKTVNLFEVKDYLENHKISKIFGDITKEQKKEIGCDFMKVGESFGKTLGKLVTGGSTMPGKSLKLVKPNYIKQPEITKPKKQCYI